MDHDVVFQEHAGTGWVILNRPKALNALSLQMVTDIYHKLKEWSENDDIALVCIKSQMEKAFCSGGDIRSISEMAKVNKSSTFFKEYFSTEYKMDLLVHKYPKPIVAFIEGVVMGGGVGLSIGAKYRIITERTKWAMPEMNIGFFPDVGASYFLNQMPGKIGTYLALTAKVLTEGDILYTNAANYYLMSSALHKVEDFIMSSIWRKETVEEQLFSFLESICIKKGKAPISLEENKINQHFQYKSMEEIMGSLDEAVEKGDKWAEGTKSLLLQKSPTSLKVTLELLQRGKEYTLEESYATDVILAQNFLHTNDFHEGVRAVLVDKDQSPRWNPDSLNEVSSDYVNSFFHFEQDEEN